MLLGSCISLRFHRWSLLFYLFPELVHSVNYFMCKEIKVRTEFSSLSSGADVPFWFYRPLSRREAVRGTVSSVTAAPPPLLCSLDENHRMEVPETTSTLLSCSQDIYPSLWELYCWRKQRSRYLKQLHALNAGANSLASSFVILMSHATSINLRYQSCVSCSLLTNDLKSCDSPFTINIWAL